MNAALAACAAGIATPAYWHLACAAARRRRLNAGALPPLLPAFAGAAGCAAALAGIAPAGIASIAAVLVAGVIDARTGSIFDPLTATLLGTSLVIAAVGGSAGGALCGAAVVGGALLLLHAAGRGRGFGLGDVKLGTGLGAALGLGGGLTAIALAFVFGGIYGTSLLLTKRARAGTAVRFGPFVAAGTIAAVVAPWAFLG